MTAAGDRLLEALEQGAHHTLARVPPPLRGAGAPTRGAGRRSVFSGRDWYHVKQPPGYYRLLELPEQPASVAVWDLWLPGLFRRWTLPAEPVIQAGTQSQALQAVLRLARRNRVDLVESTFNMARWDEAIRELVGDGTLEEFGTYVVDLTAGIDAVREGIHKKHRQGLRKAEKAALEVRTTADPEAFGELMRLTYAHGGKDNPFTPPYLSRLLVPGALSLLYVGVYERDVLAASLVVPFDERRGYYLHGASRRDAGPGASILGQVAAMERLIARGVPVYDLGGARRETDDPRLAGIFRFKRRFGGTFEPCLRWRLPLSARGRFALRRWE
jgi:hypothetical protein